MTTVDLPVQLDHFAVAALSEADDQHKYELSAEGVVQIMSPATIRHAKIIARLVQWLITHGYADQVMSEVGVYTGGGRQPDVTVWATSEEPPAVIAQYADAADLLLAVEVISPSSRQIDTVEKLREYASVGIPAYWTVEQDGAQTVTMYRRTEAGGYVVVRAVPLSWLLDQDPVALIESPAA